MSRPVLPRRRAAARRLRWLALLLAAAVTPASPGLAPRAAAATLRPFGTLNGPSVTVADIWDDAGTLGSLVLGPAPPPGERIIVAAPQLAAIARQFGVDWRPDSPAEQTVLERAGVPIPHEIIMTALAEALAGAGAPTEPSGDGIECSELVLPLIPPNAAPHVAVEQLSWDAASHRFEASIAVSVHAMSTLRLLVAGRVVAMGDAVVTTRALPSTGVLGPADVTEARVPREHLRPDALTDPHRAVGMRLRRPLGQGEPLLASELAPPEMVAKGAHVSIEIRASGVDVTASGQALAGGAIGEHIAVRNPTSRAVVLAEVVGPNQVRVEPGSLPVHPPELSAGGLDAASAQ